MGLHKDSRKNGHSLSERCDGVMFGPSQPWKHSLGYSKLRRQNSADKYSYPMRSQPTVRIRRAMERIIPLKTARITRGRPSTHCSTPLFNSVHTLGQGFLLSWSSIWVIWPLLQESLCNPLDFATPTGRAMAGMLAVFAEFERGILRERVKAGIAEARRRGTRHGRPPTVAHQADAVRQLYAEGLSKSAIARRLGIGRTSVRRFLC